MPKDIVPDSTDEGACARMRNHLWRRAHVSDQ